MRWRIVVAVVITALIALHAWRPTGAAADATYLTVVWLAVGVAWVGRNAAAAHERLVPTLVAGGLTANAVAELTYYVYVWRGLEPDASLADVAWFACYVLFGAAIWVAMVRANGGRRLDPDALIDVLTVVVISVIVFWNLSVQDIVNDDSQTAFVRSVLATYPLLDAVLLALVLRAVTGARSRRTIGPEFAIGMLTWLLADLGYLALDTTTGTTALLDVGWLVGAALVAASAWRRAPAAETLTEVDPAAAGVNVGRLLLAITPLMVPPLLLLANLVRGRDVDTLTAFIGVTALLGLAFLRTLRLLVGEAQSRRRLGDARDAALEGSRAKSAFLATMSHEIRTPMNGVIGLTGLLLTTELDQRQRQYAEGVRGAGEALLALINDILDFSKVEAGKLDLEIIDFNLVQVVEEAAELVADAAQRKDLELLAYTSPELPQVLRGDPSRLRQVLLNLAGNAVKFTETGEVVVRAHLEDRTEGGVVVRFEVTDTGLGIAAEDLGRLFDAFSQADSSTTRRFGGTGLGLAICRQLVTAMGGELGVESEPGRGSTFWFTLPLAHATDAHVPPPRTDGLAGLRVLAVDDNQTNRLILGEQLGAWDMRVDVVEDGPTALARLAGDTPYDLVVLDMCMPGMDGLEVATRVGRLPGPTPAMVLLTSSPDVSPEEAQVAGIGATLTKPVHLDRLRSALHDVLAASVPRPVSPPPNPVSISPGLGRVLVVEDSPTNQLVAVGMLEHLGYTTEVAANGLEALAALDLGQFDIVLMDCRMPEMDGFEATRELRRREVPGARLPVVALTAGVVEDEQERCREAGMDDFLAKPVSLRALDEVLSRWVGDRQG